jgi:hypothetical protein
MQSYHPAYIQLKEKDGQQFPGADEGTGIDASFAVCFGYTSGSLSSDIIGMDRWSRREFVAPESPWTA